MSDRSELALQLTDAVAAAYQAIERAGNRAYKSFGLSQRAHAAMAAIDLGGPDGARPSDVASELGVSRSSTSRPWRVRVTRTPRSSSGSVLVSTRPLASRRWMKVVAAARDTPSSLATSLGRAPSGPPRSMAAMAACARCDRPKLLYARLPARSIAW